MLEAEWVLSEAPKAWTCSLGSSAPVWRQLSLIYEVWLSPYLFRYRQQKRCGLSFFWQPAGAPGQRDTAKKKKKKKRNKGKDAEKVAKEKKNWLQSVLCWLDVLCNRQAPKGQGATRGGGEHELNAPVSVDGCDQDKSPVELLSQWDLTKTNSRVLKYVLAPLQPLPPHLHPYLHLGASVFPSQVTGVELASPFTLWACRLHCPINIYSIVGGNFVLARRLSTQYYGNLSKHLVHVYMLTFYMYLMKGQTKLNQKLQCEQKCQQYFLLLLNRAVHLGTCGLSELACLCPCLFPAPKGLVFLIYLCSL